MKQTVAVSPTLENFIEALYELHEEKTRVRVTDMSHRLHIAKSSVNQMLASLVKQELVSHENYGPLILTEKGLLYACELQRRHSVLKTFFSEVLGVDAEIADQDAGIIEHVISETTLARLANYLAAHENLTPESASPTLPLQQSAAPETNIASKKAARKRIFEIGKVSEGVMARPRKPSIVSETPIAPYCKISSGRSPVTLRPRPLFVL